MLGPIVSYAAAYFVGGILLCCISSDRADRGLVDTTIVKAADKLDGQLGIGSTDGTEKTVLLGARGQDTLPS